MLHQALFMGSLARANVSDNRNVSKNARLQRADAVAEAVVLGERADITTGDGFALAGTFYPSPVEPRGTVVIHPATSVPATFYHHFASFLATEGFATLTYDYRGIGASRRGSLVGFEADKVLWARQDMSAALEWLEDRVPGVPHYAVGHSVGGQLMGLTKRPQDIDGLVTVNTGFGYWGVMTMPYRFFVALALWGLIPFFTRVLGYLPSKRTGFGEDLPARAARQWARWAKKPTYFIDDLRDELGFARFRAPWLALRATDDAINVRANAHRFYAAYPNASPEERVLEPSAYGKKAIGHLDFFRRKNADLWPQVSDWFKGLAD